MTDDESNVPTASTPYDWLNTVDPALLQADEKPLLGPAAPFPWATFARLIAERFEVPGVTLTAKQWQWRTPSELQEGLGSPVKTTTIAISPLQGNCWWLIAEEDANTLMALALTNSSSLPLTLPDFQEAFFKFAAIEALHLYMTLGINPRQVPTLTQYKPIPSEPLLTMDICLAIKDTSIWGRLVLSNELRRALRQELFAGEEPGLTPLAKNLELTVLVEGGRVSLTQTELKQLHPGDFLLLDSYTYDPTGDKQKVSLSVAGKQVLRAKVKNDKLKILEHPLYYEVDTTMATESEENEEEFTLDEGATDLDEYDSELESEFHTEEGHTEADESTEQTAEAENSQEMTHKTEIEETATHNTATASHRIGEEQEGSHITADQIPMTLTVEVARLRMTVQTLMNLQPGNLIDLNVTPDQNVNLTVNGNIIGKGELLRIGETLGVRILNIGK